jgi:hypothetical protein
MGYVSVQAKGTIFGKLCVNTESQVKLVWDYTLVPYNIIHHMKV